MGLDLLPVGLALPGHEAEWSRLVSQFYEGHEPPEKQSERFMEISAPPYATLGAPVVGRDSEADAWLLQNKPANETASDADFLAKHTGYHVLELLDGRCDGVPRRSHGGLYDGVDRTSFRGSFLQDCASLLDDKTINRAWTFCMSPEDAVQYGRDLLNAAKGRAIEQPISKPKSGLWRRLLGVPALVRAPSPIQEQRGILDEAGRWYVFWGSRGHPIWAYF